MKWNQRIFTYTRVPCSQSLHFVRLGRHCSPCSHCSVVCTMQSLHCATQSLRPFHWVLARYWSIMHHSYTAHYKTLANLQFQQIVLVKIIFQWENLSAIKYEILQYFIRKGIQEQNSLPKYKKILLAVCNWYQYFRPFFRLVSLVKTSLLWPERRRKKKKEKNVYSN